MVKLLLRKPMEIGPEQMGAYFLALGGKSCDAACAELNSSCDL